MTNSVDTSLDTLELAQLAEAAQSVLPDIVDIDDPTEGAARVAALCSLPPEAAADIDALAQDVGRHSLAEMTGLLRAVLADVAAGGPEDAATVIAAAKEAGGKQISVGPELYGMCSLLITAYIAWATKGKKSFTREVEFTQDKDGRFKITIRERTLYLSPFSSLAGLIKKAVGQDDADGGTQASG